MLTSASISPAIAAALQHSPHDCTGFIPRGMLIPANTVDTLLSYQVTIDGETRNVMLFRSSGSRDLDNAAIACANATRFPPQLVDGKPAEISAIGSVPWLTFPRPFVRFARYGIQSACKQTAGFFHRRNESGTTIVSYRIAGDGGIKDVTLTQSSGNSHLDDSVVSCASAMRFYPIICNGHPVETEQELGVRWSESEL